MKQNDVCGEVIIKKLEDLSEAECRHLERICEMGHQKNEQLKEEALVKKRQMERAAEG